MRFTARQQALLSVHRKPTVSWIRGDVAGSSAELVYASVLTSASTGETEIYEQSGKTLALVGQLNEGGGPVAVDRDQNVYVAEAGSNALGFCARNVYEYARGSTTPKRVLQNPNMSWAMAVGYDGTVYVAGMEVAPTAHPSVIVRYAHGATTGQTVRIGDVNPSQPTGLAVDAAGDLFAGWNPTDDTVSRKCAVGSLIGCVEKLAVGAKSWKTLLYAGGAASTNTSGPILDGNGDVVLTTLWSRSLLQTLLTFPKGAWMPSQALSVPAASIQMFAMTFGPPGQTIWTMNTLFNGTVPPTIWLLDYPSGTLQITFPIPQDPVAIAADDGIAVSPAYYP